jgi:hypothetical protein
MFVGAVAFHHAALAFELYGNPPHPDLRIDVYTHSASSFAVVALLFNFNLSRQRSRWYTWGIPIAGAFVIGVAWERRTPPESLVDALGTLQIQSLELPWF